MPNILYIVPTEASARVYRSAADAYVSRPYEERDAGFDLFSAETSCAGTTRIDQQCVAAYYDNSRNLFRAFFLLPRSSISRTPLRMANSVGLIDAGYRGPIMAAVDGAYDVQIHARLFQLVAPDLLPWDDVRIVSAIPGGPTLRDAGGFGSTGTGTDYPSTITHVATYEDISGARVDLSGARIVTHQDISVARVDLSGARLGRMGPSDGW